MKIIRGEIERDEEGKYLVKLLNHRERERQGKENARVKYEILSRLCAINT